MQAITSWLKAPTKFIKTLIQILLLVAFYLSYKYLTAEMISWEVFPRIVLLYLSTLISFMLLCYITVGEYTRKAWIKVIIILAGALILIGVPIGCIYYNSKYCDGMIPDIFLGYVYYPIISLGVVCFLAYVIRAYLVTRKSAIKFIAAILVGGFSLYMVTDYRFTNYIHKDGYKDLSSQKIVEANFEDNSLMFTLAYGNSCLDCKISNYGVSGWRVQSAKDGEISDYGAGQLLSYYLNEESACKKEAIEGVPNSEGYTLVAQDGTRAVVSYNPFLITFISKSGAESQTINTIGISNGTTVVRGNLLKEEAMWGGGEHFDKINQRGQKLKINSIDIWGGIEGNSYMPIPILVSSRGSGLFMNRYERMVIDVDTYDIPKNTWQFEMPYCACDLFVYATDNPQEVLYGYSTISGFAPNPSEWNYGIVVCRYAPEFMSLEGVQEMARQMEANDMPWDAIILEGFDFTKISTDEEEYQGSLQEVVDYVHGLGKKVLMYCASGKTYYYTFDEEQMKYVARADNGSIALAEAFIDNPVDHPGILTGVYVDFTDKEFREYWFGDVMPGLFEEVGLDGAKIDFCEQFPDYYELSFADGTTSGAHHWYSTIYNILQYEAMSKNENGTMALARGGSIGAQRYPFVWMGDQRREMKYVESVLKGVISSGISGIPFTTYDMAGYRTGYIGDEEEVFMRAVEYSAFIGCIQTHGDVKRPYDYDQNVRDVYRAYTKIHEALRPYFVEQGEISSTTGLPLVRHLGLSYWTDKNVWDIEDEFMLGSDILVAPVLEDGKTSRDIYLPEGNWINLWTGEQISGGKWLRNNKQELEDIAVFVKADMESEVLEGCIDEIRALYQTRK